MITLKGTLQHNLMQIETTSVNLRNSFLAGQTIANGIYTGNINATNNLFNVAQSKTALAFNVVIASCYSFVLQIANSMN